MVYFREYDIVRVIKLLRPNRTFEGTESVSHSPKVGDVATICHMYDPDDPTAIRRLIIRKYMADYPINAQKCLNNSNRAKLRVTHYLACYEQIAIA